MKNCTSAAVVPSDIGIRRKAGRRLLGALLAGSAITLPAAAAAQSITWDGEAGIDWATPANWSGNALPGSADTVIINVLDSAVQPTMLTPQTVAQTDILNGTLTVSSALTSALVRLPDSGSSVTSLDPGQLVVTAGGSIIGTLRVSGFEFSGTATRIEGPITVAPNTGISVTGGGIAEFSSISLGNGGTARSGFVTVSGAGSRLSAGVFEADGSSHTILVSGGATLSTNQASISRGSATVTGAGSVWNIAATSNDNTRFGFNTPFTLNVLDGGRISSLNPVSMQIGGTSAVRIAGAGSTIELASSLSIGGTSSSQPAGSFVIEDGGSLIVHNPAGAGLGQSNQRGEVIIRNGGSWILDGGPNAGLLINSADLLIDGGTFSAGGIVSYSGTILSLRNANFTARGLDASNLVQIGGGASEPAAAAGIFDVGTVLLRGESRLVLNHTQQDYVIASEFQGLPGAVISHIAGDTIFTGPFGGYGGDFNITGGSVRFNGSFGGNGARAAVDSEGGLATVGGSGTFGGTLSVVNGTLAPGDGAGALGIGRDLVLGPNAVLAFELGAPGGTPGAGSDLVNVTGNLTLDGTLNVADAGGFGAGLYRLINYGGTLTDSGLDLGSLPSGIIRSDLQVQTSVANQVNLVVAVPTPTSFPFWDGSNTSGDGTIGGGSGIWNAAGTNWTTTDAATNGAYNPADFLIFTGPTTIEEPQQFAAAAFAAAQITAATPSATAGTVTVDAGAGDVTLKNGMQFAVDGYTVTGDALVLAATVPCGECTPLPGKVTVRVGDGTAAGAGFVATIQSALTGAAGLGKTDLGTLILAGSNTYTGGTEVTNGMLQGDALSLQGAINVGADGTLLFAQGTDGAYGSALSGSGLFAKQGAGTLTLSGDSSGFAGTSSITGGELAVDGTLGSSSHVLQLGGGATLSGGGRIGGSVAVEDGALSPGGASPDQAAGRLAASAAAAGGDAVGLLTIGGDLSLSAASILAFQLGDPAGAAGVASDLINVGSNLVLDGTLDVRDAGGFGAGLYRLINYGGTLTDNGLGIGAVPTGFTADDLTVQTSVADQVNLVVGAPITSFMFWDGVNTAGNGAVDGGTAIWRADTTNWTIASGSRNGVVDPGQLLIFAGTAGTVTVDTAGGPVRAAAGMQFAATGYRVEGGPIVLDGPVATVRVGDGTAPGKDISATIASVLTGAARLDKTDLGTLILSGANTYAGGTRVLGGVLQIADDGALGASGGAVTLDGGTLSTAADLTTARGLAVGSGGGTLDSAGHALTLSGTISGAGRLAFAGTGLRTITGSSAGFAGTAALAAGTLALPGSLGGTLAVAAPARLIGTGRAGSLDLAGTFSPGTASGKIGTFNVTGDLTVRAGSRLLIDLAASGASDRVEVGGRAVLEGGTAVVTALDPELNYADGTVYRIINAAGGRTGTLAGLTETSAFLDFSLGYDATGVFLTTDVIAQFPDVAETPNQIETSETLSNLDPAAGSDPLAVYNEILLLDADRARAAFDAASGEIYPTLLAGRQRAGMALIGRITNRSRALGREGLSMWGGAPGDRWHVDGDGNGARSTADSVGLESGLDYRGPDNLWAFGLGGGWQDGQVNLQARASRAKLDAWHIGGYARYGSGGAGFTAVTSAVYATADARVTRQIGIGTIARTATSSVNLGTLAVRGETRFGFGGTRLAVGPLASVDLTSTRIGPFFETGADALNLSGKAKHESWTRYGLGGFARIGIGRGFADLAVRYERRDRGDTSLNLTMAGSPAGFAVRTAGGSRSALRVDASTEFAIGDRWAISANVGGTQANKEGQLDGSVRLSYRF